MNDDQQKAKILNTPVKEIGVGRVKADIYVNQTEYGSKYNTNIYKIYQSKEGEKKWERTHSYFFRI